MELLHKLHHQQSISTIYCIPVSASISRIASALASIHNKNITSTSNQSSVANCQLIKQLARLSEETQPSASKMTRKQPPSKAINLQVLPA
ncbi:hypothetical protein L6452_36907 [Arctium lappa]|uniref:Uncharacterized protein n=1 Tax=Arctium lappa TaxID=4217 RepID=A0ACB8Y273_ARCLA|nr:hypothetical protein L6452_36907 [Arctium lappa]